MPPKSEKQRRFMEMIVHSKKKINSGPSKKVAEKILHHNKDKK